MANLSTMERTALMLGVPLEVEHEGKKGSIIRLEIIGDQIEVDYCTVGEIKPTKVNLYVVK